MNLYAKLLSLSLVILMTMCTIAADAQQTPPSDSNLPVGVKLVQKTIKLKHGMNGKVSDYVEFFTATHRRKNPTMNLVVASELGWISIEGREELVNEFEKSIQEFDVPMTDLAEERRKTIQRDSEARQNAIARQQSLEAAAMEKQQEQERKMLLLPEPKLVEKTIKLKYGMTDKILELVNMYSESSRVVVRRISPDKSQSTITQGLEIKVSQSLGWIRVSGDEDRAEEFENAVREVDMKPQNVMLAFYLVRALDSGGDMKFPKEIEPAIEQLVGTFQYDSYQLIDTALLRGRDGQLMHHVSGLPVSKLGRDGVAYTNAKCSVQISQLSLYKDGDRDVFGFEVDFQVSLEKPIVTENVPVNVNPQSGFQARNNIRYVKVLANMRSSVDIREGQSVVLGKSNFDNTDDALFVIVQAHAVD